MKPLASYSEELQLGLTWHGLFTDPFPHTGQVVVVYQIDHLHFQTNNLMPCLWTGYASTLYLLCNLDKNYQYFLTGWSLCFLELNCYSMISNAYFRFLCATHTQKCLSNQRRNFFKTGVLCRCWEQHIAQFIPMENGHTSTRRVHHNCDSRSYCSGTALRAHMWFKETWKVKEQSSVLWKKRKTISVETDIIDLDDMMHAAIAALYWGTMVAEVL